MSHLLLGIDIGTSSCKCSLVDHTGNVVGCAKHEYSPDFPALGWVEQDPTVWYAAAIACLKDIVAQTGITMDQVEAVGVTGQMRGPTFIDNQGDVIRPSILWNDLRCQAEVEELNTGYEAMLSDITHNPLNTMCTLPKLLWLIRHEPETWARTAVMVYPKDYINFRLIGEPSTDLSDASGSSFYAMKRQTWSSEILDTFGIAQEKLPTIYPSTAVIGVVSPEASTETGLKRGTPVVAGGSDATVELLATGVGSDRQCKVRLGTSGALSTVVDRLNFQENDKCYYWSYLLPDRWMLDINTRACAASTVWLRNVFYKDMASDEAYAQIEREAATIPPGSEGLFFHPYLLGEDAPYWQPHLKGSFFGLTAAHRREHCARAVLEGTGFALRDARSGLGAVVDNFENYYFVGGGVKNRLWLSIVADILGIDGQIASNADAAVGAAMLAGIGTEVFIDVQQAIEVFGQHEERVKHDPENHAHYTRLFDKYVQMKQLFDAVYQD